MLQNYIDGRWQSVETSDSVPIIDPSCEEIIAQCPLSKASEVEKAVRAANKAFSSWRSTPAIDRVQYLFKIKAILEKNQEELARICTKEHGKTLSESFAELRRSIQMVDTACGMPSLLMGTSFEDVAAGIDCVGLRQPMGVFAAITPFNFPLMVPFWFWPFAIAAGNTFVLKPSERVSLSSVKFFELIEEAALPKGVLNLVLGGREAADALLISPEIKGISFVGSTPVARHVYAKGCEHGKRVQALGGAKNFMVVLPDAIIKDSAKTCVESIVGCAGQRCLAGSVIIAVGDSYERILPEVLDMAKNMTVGAGLNSENAMGPLISRVAVERVSALIQSGIDEGAELLLDGRVYAKARGYFLGPTVLSEVKANMRVAKEEIFGPLICLARANNLDEAISVINNSPFANTASIFTESGAAARQFQYQAHPAMLGLNIGVPAPMSFFSFGGAKDSFFGDVKAHGSASVQFYTDTKVVIERWNKHSSIW